MERFLQQSALWALAIGLGLLVGVTLVGDDTLGWMLAALIAWLAKTAADLIMARRRGP